MRRGRNDGTLPSAPAGASSINLCDVHLALGDDPPAPVLGGVDLLAPAGEVTAIVGPSGCGKSTLLDVIAGLREPDHGQVLVGGHHADRIGRVALMPQRDALMPWRTLLANVEAGARLAGDAPDVARARARVALQQAGLAGFEHHYPHALSGGMRQRGALARTLLSGRGTWLLDEPFGALDALTRSEMHGVLKETCARHRPTVLLVTHDIAEAVLLAETVLVAGPSPMRIVDVIDTHAEGDAGGRERALESLRAAGVAA